VQVEIDPIQGRDWHASVKHVRVMQCADTDERPHRVSLVPRRSDTSPT